MALFLVWFFIVLHPCLIAMFVVFCCFFQPSERGAMNEVYEKYRSLKRGVRDQAAKSIQRLIRGFITRRRVRGQRVRLQVSLPVKSTTSSFGTTGGTEIISSSLPGKRKGIESTGSSVRPLSGSADSNASGGGLREDRQSMGSKVPADIFAKYKDLWGQKHELKRRLKKFDDDFAQQHKRQPTKAEKEVCTRKAIHTRSLCYG